jgi:hypothetical protein
MVNGDSAIVGKYGGQDKEGVSIVWKLVMRLANSGDKKWVIVPSPSEPADRTTKVP